MRSDRTEFESVSIDFKTPGAAFDEYPASEIARILRKIADRIEAGRDCGVIYCLNGNNIGNWSISKA